MLEKVFEISILRNRTSLKLERTTRVLLKTRKFSFFFLKEGSIKLDGYSSKEIFGKIAIEIAKGIEVAFFYNIFYLKLLFTNSTIIRVSLNRIALLARDASLISKLYRKFLTRSVPSYCSILYKLLYTDINAINGSI